MVTELSSVFILNTTWYEKFKFMALCKEFLDENLDQVFTYKLNFLFVESNGIFGTHYQNELSIHLKGHEPLYITIVVEDGQVNNKKKILDSIKEHFNKSKIIKENRNITLKNILND